MLSARAAAALTPWLRGRRWIWPGAGLLVALLVAVEAQTPWKTGFQAPVWTAGLLTALLVALAPLAPVPAALLGCAGIFLNVALGMPGVGGGQLVGILLLVGSVGAVRGPRTSLAVAAAGALFLDAATLYAAGATFDLLFYPGLLAVAVLVGLVVRHSREQARELEVLAGRLADQQQALSASAVVAERARVAREVHDSVGHAVSVMVLQMGGLRRLLPDRPEAQAVLQGLERLGRDSVDELRRVVGILRRSTGEPAPLTPVPAPVDVPPPPAAPGPPPASVPGQDLLHSRWAWPATGLLIGVMVAVETGLVTGAPLTASTSGVGLAAAVLVALGRIAPVPAALLASATMVASVALGRPGPGGAQMAGSLLLLGHVAAVRSPRMALATAVAATALDVVGGALLGGSPADSLVWVGLNTAALLIGSVVRSNGQRAVRLAELTGRLAAQQETVAAAATTAERARIAGEVHDSVAHAVSVMVLQLGGLRRLLPDHPEAQEVLQGLERLGRESVDEMRRVVGVLREDADGDPAPLPSLSRLDGVLRELRAGGMPLELRVTGQPVELPQLVDVSAVRVVQEALSNVVRHAGAAATVVEVGYAPGEVTVTVTDDGRPRVRVPAPAPGGHGLLHMRERVSVAGGRFDAGPAGGGYRVRAAFPLHAADREEVTA